MKSHMTISHQRSMAHLRRVYAQADPDPELTRHYRAHRAALLMDAMEWRALDKAWTKAMYPRTYQKEYPND